MSAETAYLVLFRGVGGKTQLATGPLREALAQAGFRDVATYINSGNAILASDAGAAEVKRKVAAIAAREFGFDKEVIVVDRRDWARMIERNPFPEATAKPTSLHVFALEAEPEKEAVAALAAKATGPERFAVIGRFLYFHTPQGFGTSKLAPRIEKTLKVPMTARNWNTVLKLDEMAAAAVVE